MKIYASTSNMNLFNQSIPSYEEEEPTDNVPIQNSSLYLTNQNYQLNMSDNVYLEYMTISLNPSGLSSSRVWNITMSGILSDSNPTTNIIIQFDNIPFFNASSIIFKGLLQGVFSLETTLYNAISYWAYDYDKNTQMLTLLFNDGNTISFDTPKVFYTQIQINDDVCPPLTTITAEKWLRNNFCINRHDQYRFYNSSANPYIHYTIYNQKYRIYQDKKERFKLKLYIQDYNSGTPNTTPSTTYNGTLFWINYDRAPPLTETEFITVTNQTSTNICVNIRTAENTWIVGALIPPQKNVVAKLRFNFFETPSFQWYNGVHPFYNNISEGSEYKLCG